VTVAESLFKIFLRFRILKSQFLQQHFVLAPKMRDAGDSHPSVRDAVYSLIANAEVQVRGQLLGPWGLQTSATLHFPGTPSRLVMAPDYVSCFAGKAAGFV
jgi:hypothetical protein